MDASVDIGRTRSDALGMSYEQADAPAEPQLETTEHEQPVPDVFGQISRLEASTGAALALLRRCIVEDKSPTREALAAEAGFAFGIPGDAAMAELDEIAQMVGVSSLR